MLQEAGDGWQEEKAALRQTSKQEPRALRTVKIPEEQYNTIAWGSKMRDGPVCPAEHTEQAPTRWLGSGTLLVSLAYTSQIS